MNERDDSCPSCPKCDGFGMVDVPGQPGKLQPCRECDSPPYHFPSLAEIVGPPEEGEKEYYAELERRDKERRDREDREFVEAEMRKEKTNASE